MATIIEHMFDHVGGKVKPSACASGASAGDRVLATRPHRAGVTAFPAGCSP
jgi:hypothetical protein